MTAASSTHDQLPQPMLDAFPTRPLVARPGRFPVSSLLWTLAMVGMAVVAILLSWRSLAPDYAMRDDAVAAPVAGVEGSCTVSAYFLAHCSVTLTYPTGSELREVERSYFWVELDNTASYSEVVVAPDGDNATLQLAQDRLTNRLLTSVGFVLVCLWLASLGVRHLRRFKGLRERYGTESGLVLLPVAARLMPVPRRGGLPSHSSGFLVAAEGRPATWAHPLSSREGAPFTTSSGLAVAVVPADEEGEPVLLDAALSRLNLTEEERAALLEAAAWS